MIKRRIKREKIKIGDIFNKLNIPNKENTQYSPEFYFKVKTPYGYKNIKILFRTEKQQSIRCYFGNNKTLECGLDHRLKVNGEWKKIKDIQLDNDIIETETGLTYLKRIYYGKEKILYDLSVEDVHCYYSNEVLSHNSWMLVAIANHAAKLGKNVIYYTMELGEDYVGLRHDARESGFASQDVKFHQDEVFNAISKVHGNLIIKFFPTKNATIDTIRTHIIRTETHGYKPDMIIIDYPDLLKGQANYARVEKRFELENIYEHTRGLGGELQIPIWGACFHGDTIIYSPIGKYKIKDLIGKKDFPVYSYNHEKDKIELKTVNLVYKSGKNKELWKVILDNGKEVITTPNHNFMLRNGKYKELKDLKVGDSLMPFNRRMKNNRKQIYLNNGKWEHQYKLVGEWKYNDIPKYHQIHHKDYNKFNDHPDNLELLTISEHYKIHGRDSWKEHNPCGLNHLREQYSERMKINNPMFNKDTREKVSKSRKGKCVGDDNPMRLEENKEKFRGKNAPSKNPNVRRRISKTVVNIWKNRTDEERKIIGQRIQLTRYGLSKNERIKRHRNIALNLDSRNDYLNKTKDIPLRRSDKYDIWNNINHKIIKIEFYGYDDVYNMEVDELHNYALDAGIVVKNSQANRSSLDDEVIEAGKIAESYNKIMIADFVISLQRKTKDKLAHTGRVHVIKNRFGPDGFTFPSKMNASNGNIQLFAEKSDEGRQTTKDTEHGGKLERMKIGEKVAELSERSKKYDELA